MRVPGGPEGGWGLLTRSEVGTLFWLRMTRAYLKRLCGGGRGLWGGGGAADGSWMSDWREEGGGGTDLSGVY